MAATTSPLSRDLQAEGWVVVGVTIRSDSERMTLRNTRVLPNSADARMSRLLNYLSTDGWTLIHYGQIGGIWSVMLERDRTS